MGISGQNMDSKIVSTCTSTNVSSERKLPSYALNAHFHPSPQILVADRCSSEGHVASMMGIDAHRDLGTAKVPHPSLNTIFFFENNPFCMPAQRYEHIFRLKMILCACGIRDTSPARSGRQLSLKGCGSQNCQSPDVSRGFHLCCP